MIGRLFHTILYVPIYNLLIFFVDIVPNGDVGLAVIAVTVVVKLLLAPFSISALPTHISPLFLGIFPTTGHTIVLALVAAAFQFLQARITIPVPPKAEKASSTEEFARAMSLQSRFILPLLIGAIAYTTGALALY